ncbi:transporter associated domain-containing protein [Methylobacillus glycogenes]|uniref:transporter associated domain-containing protein n=1 Tax=Methylobacillus glycogenes TaxID=406 RepID=UPI0034E2FB07
MRPFNEAISLSAENTLEQNLEIISQHRYSRYPFVELDGKVKGVIHLKSLFLAKFEAEELQDLGRYIHPAPFVAPDMPAIELFRRFREGKASHFAIVGRKGQEPLGFITLDNMLGALVGEIRDEFRQSQNDWTKLDDGTLIGKGSLPIFTLERALGVEIDNDDEVDSVGGLVLSKLEDIPKEGDSISFGAFDIVIKKMNGPRIILVRIHPRQVSE